MTFPNEFAGASEVVDEDVGVDEEVSHGASRRATGPRRRVLLRTWRPVSALTRVSLWFVDVSGDRNVDHESQVPAWFSIDTADAVGP